jgi:hypothetical protein
VIGKDKLAVLVIFASVVASVLTYRLLSANGADSPRIPDAPQSRPAGVNEFRGITLQLQSGWAEHPYEQYIDEIAQTGANTVSFVIAGYQENGASTSIFIDLRKAPTDLRLIDLIAKAHARNLHVVLMPIVLLENAREGEWRGKIAPTSWDDWWEDYNDFIIRYARIAEQTGTQLLVIGSELVTTEQFADRWRELIRSVRGVYKGQLCYSANWDHYRPVEWWDDMDIVGMTTYYDLTEGKEPTVERLLEAWKPIKKDILTWREGINRPILFTEVGWPNQTTCAQYPWDYYRSTNEPDTKAQANCFEAFFQTWVPERSVAGFLVWEWRNHPKQAIGPDDTSYVPVGKPALDVIRKYYQMPSAREAEKPPTTQPVTTTPTTHRTQ